MIARALRNAPRACIAAPRRGLGALRARLADLVEDRGETEVLQYGAMKWTVRDAKRYGDGLARGLAEFGVQAGDAVASLLSPDAPEQHCIELAAAVSGVVSCRVDAALGARGVRDALNEAEAVLAAKVAEAKCAILERELRHVQSPQGNLVDGGDGDIPPAATR